jgi:hypothetical protein
MYNIPGHVGCDCSGLDGTISVVLRECEREFLLHMFPSFSTTINNLMDKEIYGCFKVVILPNGKMLIVPTHGSRLSGSAMTSFGNTFLMLFTQWLKLHVVDKITGEKAIYLIGLGYGDDTTTHNRNIDSLSIFMDILGIELTKEKSETGTLMFLSELVTPDGNICHLERMIKKAYRYYTPFSDRVGFIYKLTGYFNPNKPIFSDKTGLFSQSPVFSLYGYYAHYLLDIMYKGQNREAIDAKKMKALGADWQYQIFSGHKWASYEEYYPGITRIHKQTRENLQKCIADNLKSHNVNEMIDKLKQEFVKTLNILRPVDTRAIDTNPKKTFPVVDDHPLQNGKITIETNMENHIRFFNYVAKHKDISLALALCNKELLFWQSLLKLANQGLFYKEYRAAADIIIKQLLIIKQQYKTIYYRQCNKNKNKNKTRNLTNKLLSDQMGSNNK